VEIKEKKTEEKVSPAGKFGKYNVTLDRSTNASYHKFKSEYISKYGEVTDSDLLNYLISAAFSKNIGTSLK